MSKKITYLIVSALVLLIFLLTVFSIRDDTFTFDETAHIVAGYSYLTQQDIRLNPEHPPLLKDLAAIPLLFLNLNFPKEHSAWTQLDGPVWWQQFELGSQFLYHSGNNPDQILFWSRLPMIFLLIILALFVFFWSKQLFGNKAGLLSLFLFALSPTLLAHGRLVTTDVGAAFGIVLSTYFWLKFLKNPIKKNIFLTGLVFGMAMICKFSLVLLTPFFAFITIVYALLNKKNALKYAGLALLAGIIGLIFIIWPVYQYHILKYPAEQQLRDIRLQLSTTNTPRFLANFNQWLAQKPIFRPLAQYLFGLLLIINRGTTGNTTYFLGQISAHGWKIYFPLVYLIKETLTFHILTLIAILTAALAIDPSPLAKGEGWRNTWKRLKTWIKTHFPEFSMLCFIALYWFASLKSDLNIGVRHLLPVFPFTIILISKQVISLLRPPYLKTKYAILFLLLIWQVTAVISVYPYFLSYFNEIVGGPANGYIYVVDSNLDWGQDLKRLIHWVEKNLPADSQIYIDYFGGGNPEYYLKEKFVPWWGSRNPEELKKPAYLAVSVSLLQGGRGKPTSGFDQPTGYYLWLDKYEPIVKIGYSIFIYHLK